MIVLDIVSKFRNTIEVFERYDRKAVFCICCNSLFAPLKNVADRYNLDLQKLIADLKAVE
jgi:hypothetical protein